ncbi:uncharacterized protein K452DRAFT_309052 [Aplosporella prunicola CBS 121167]|uniref:HbrB-like protein n=1 Tax=Aplosporella prunicola CBS 121167 TaxID=1176127 RepID=A0A6A6BB49_9PEZI|nr:uncharacterized protein K452DRAFT_309052 [Aplosporella prunicola CBS 121167]KAF2141266.1 hypothetical protein K452DRAFT_309052 [Aplosporella prunicola CBS 121167]
MASSPARTVLTSPPSRPTPPGQQTPTSYRRRGASTDYDNDSESDSDTSRVTALTVNKHQSISPPAPAPRPTVTSNVSSPLNDLPLRNHSPGTNTPPVHLGHRPRQHSQGFFEPSLPSAHQTNMPNLSASQIAAQTAMHARSEDSNHNRNRSATIPEGGVSNNNTARRKPSQPTPPAPELGMGLRPPALQVPSFHQIDTAAAQRGPASAAANSVFPRSPLASPGLMDLAPRSATPSMSEGQYKPLKEKEKSKMKLFSKPKSLGLSKDKDALKSEKYLPALPSPNKQGLYSSGAHAMNQSTSSLVTPNIPNTPLYSSANASTSTLLPMERVTTHVEKEKEKEKHRHHFLSRQKNKLKDDHHNLPLSSASSTSKPTDPHAPQPLYNFAAPNSPGHSSTFAQSMSGLDLRHGGRALRQKKKEEKAANASLESGLETPYRERDPSFQLERAEWPGPNNLGTSAPTPGLGTLETSQPSVATLSAIFGVTMMTPDDAWPLIKARVLLIFEGQDPRPPIEDFNSLVSMHLRRCIQRQAPHIVVEDLNELLLTGFLSLDQTLRHIPDDRLVPKLVEVWDLVFTKILPFMQAVFLPLDLEFRGAGIMNPREAAGFWGASLPKRDPDEAADNIKSKAVPTLGEELEVRRLTLLMFRDSIFLPRHDALMAIFSRLSLENINAGIGDPSYLSETSSHQTSTTTYTHRPGTSISLGADGFESSQGSSNILDSTSTSFSASATFSANTRSRATSNTSAGSFHSLPTNVQLGHGRSHSNSNATMPPPAASSAASAQPMDSAKVTETVAKMLQCISVLSSIRSGDEPQAKMESLSRELKYNWLGRGRTGRQRQGFVGRKGVGLGAMSAHSRG